MPEFKCPVPECGATTTKDGRPFTEAGLKAHMLRAHKIKVDNPIQPKEPEIPEIINIELTPQAYQKIKEKILAGQKVRTHIETYFEWLQTIEPMDVMNFIETGKSLKDAYQEAPTRWRLAIAIGRGVIKSVPKYRSQLEQLIKDANVTLTTLKFENPAVHQLIMRYGEQGTQFLKECQESALEIFGLKQREPTKTD